MDSFLQLEKYSIGVGDRFGRQAQAQLKACMLAAEHGVRVIPVWNKSHREHAIIGSQPASTRQAAAAAVQALGWKHPYHVDADHVKHATFTPFLPHSDYFTLDVGDAIDAPVSHDALEAFLGRHPELHGQVKVPWLDGPLQVSQGELRATLRKYLPAVLEAGALYRAIAGAKAVGTFITEVSMDETDIPQSPRELLVILAALADEGVQVQAIAPRFAGRFNKGVDYAGDLSLFAHQFKQDLAVIAYAVLNYGLPSTLKLSVHSGSDKFSLYPLIRMALDQFDAGVHLKTAGTTWLEELAGLAGADAAGCGIAKTIYFEALHRIEELCQPYASVISIDREKLPPRAEVANWQPSQLVSAITHDPANPSYNPELRQLLHVSYKIAAEMGSAYLDALRRCQEVVAEKVTANLYQRHVRPLFLSGREFSSRVV